MRGRVVLAMVAAAGLSACTVDDRPPTVATVGVATEASERARAFHGGADPVGTPMLYVAGRAPASLDGWQALPVPAEPLPLVVYLPACSSPSAARDHIPFLQRQGVAVLVPSLRRFGCVDAEASFTAMRVEVRRATEAARDIPWIDEDRVYLMGHSVGADLAMTIDRPLLVTGTVGLAAACTFGSAPRIPTLAFRAADDPVLAVRRTNCADVVGPNLAYVEVPGDDHVLRLGTDDARRAEPIAPRIAAFIGGGTLHGPSVTASR